MQMAVDGAVRGPGGFRGRGSRGQQAVRGGCFRCQQGTHHSLGGRVEVGVDGATAKRRPGTFQKQQAGSGAFVNGVVRTRRDSREHVVHVIHVSVRQWCGEDAGPALLGLVTLPSVW